MSAKQHFRSRLLTDILRLSGDMPNRAAHRAWLATLSDEQLASRLALMRQPPTPWGDGELQAMSKRQGRRVFSTYGRDGSPSRPPVSATLP